MRYAKKLWITFLLSAFCLTGLSGCAFSGPVALSAQKVQLNVGQVYALSVCNTSTKSLEYTTQWQTSNENIVSVQDGLLTGISEGEAEITAVATVKQENGSSQQKNMTCKVVVGNFEVQTQSFTLTSPYTTIEPGTTVALSAQFTPDNATQTQLTWNSSDESVATVQDGIVTAVQRGSVTITASLTDKPEIQASITLTVASVNDVVESLELSETEISLTAGQTKQIQLKIDPIIYDGPIAWTSSDPAVAEVSDGTVKAISAGTTEIQVAAGDKTASCTVRVTGEAKTSVSLNQTSVSITDGQTQQMQFSVSVSPTAMDRDGKWSVSDTTYASVDQTGLVTFKPLPQGEQFDYVQIYVTYQIASGEKASCKIIMQRNKQESDQEVEDVIIDGTNRTLQVGQTLTLSYTVVPTGAAADFGWKSDDPEIVSVQDGKITALQEGTTRITLYLKSNPDICSRIKITVE